MKMRPGWGAPLETGGGGWGVKVQRFVCLCHSIKIKRQTREFGVPLVTVFYVVMADVLICSKAFSQRKPALI